MRWKGFAAVCAAVASIGLASPAPANANGVHHSRAPHGWAHERVIHHHIYYPRATHVYHLYGRGDPFAYRPKHRGYYPYYDSGYWRSAHEMRHRPKPYYQLPKYYPAWGYTGHWHHRQWHHENHGRHHHWHW